MSGRRTTIPTPEKESFLDAIEDLETKLREGHPDEASYARWFNHTQYRVSQHPQILKMQQPILALNYLAHHFKNHPSNSLQFLLWPEQDPTGEAAMTFIEEELLPQLNELSRSPDLTDDAKRAFRLLLNQAAACSPLFGQMIFKAGLPLKGLDHAMIFQSFSQAVQKTIGDDNHAHLIVLKKTLLDLVFDELEKRDRQDAYAIASGIFSGTRELAARLLPSPADDSHAARIKKSLNSEMTQEAHRDFHQTLSILNEALRADSRRNTTLLDQGLHIKNRAPSSGEAHRAKLVHELLCQANMPRTRNDHKGFITKKSEIIAKLLQQKSGVVVETPSVRGRSLAQALINLTRAQLQKHANLERIFRLINPALAPAKRLKLAAFGIRRSSVLAPSPTAFHTETTGSGRELVMSKLALQKQRAAHPSGAGAGAFDRDSGPEETPSARIAWASAYRKPANARALRAARMHQDYATLLDSPTASPAVSSPRPPSTLPPPPPLSAHPDYDPLTGLLSRTPSSLSQASGRPLRDLFHSAISGSPKTPTPHTPTSADSASAEDVERLARMGASLMREASARSTSTAGSFRELLAAAATPELNAWSTNPLAKQP